MSRAGLLFATEVGDHQRRGWPPSSGSAPSPPAEPAGSAPSPLDPHRSPSVDAPSVTTGPTPFDLPGRPAEVLPGASLGLRFHPSGTPAFADLPAPQHAAGHLLGELTLDGWARAPAAPGLRHGSLRVAPAATEASPFQYRLVRRLPATAAERQRAQLLLAEACPPQLVDLAGLEPGEAHTVSALLRLEVGLELASGADLEVPPALQQLTPEPIRLAAVAALRSWAGLELTDRFELEVGRAGLLEPGRVRLRLRRGGQGGLSPGAGLALAGALGARRAADALLDAAFAAPGLGRLVEALARLEQLDQAGDLLARGHVEAVQEQLDDTTAALVADFLSPDRVWSAVTSTSAARSVLDGVRHLVGAVEGVDPLARSLVDLLARMDGDNPEATHAALAWVAQLEGPPDGARLEALPPPTAALLETLSGLDLERLACGGVDAEGALARAAHLARQAQQLLAQLVHLPGPVHRRLAGFLRRTGARGLLETLDAVPSAAALGAHARRCAGVLAHQVLGHHPADAGPDELARLKSWAGAQRSLLDDTGPASLDSTLRHAVDRLTSALGFAAALELDRLSRAAPVLDLELDPRSDLAREVRQRLAGGDLGGAILAASAPPGDDRGAPCLVRASLLGARGARSSGALALSSLLERPPNSCHRLGETPVWLEPGAHAAEPSPRTRHAGGVAVTAHRGDGSASQQRAWLVWRTPAPAPDPTPATLEAELELSLLRQHPCCTRGDLLALDTLLGDLGFLTEPAPWSGRRDHPQVRASLALRLPRRVFAAVLVCLDREDDAVRQAWRRDFDNALHRWFSDRWTPDRDPSAPHRRTGSALATVLRSRWYRTLGEPVRNEGPPPPPLRGSLTTGPPFLPALAAVVTRDHTLRALGRLARACRRAATTPTDAALAQAGLRATEAFAVPSFLPWPDPGLLLWLLHARLCRKAPQLLQQVTGVATVRWRPRGGGAWECSGPLTLTGGLRAHPVGERGSVYPL